MARQDKWPIRMASIEFILAQALQPARGTALAVLLSLLILPAMLSAEADLRAAPVCDCEKIKKEQKCDNLNCIKICNLTSAFASAGRLLEEQCMQKIAGKQQLKQKVSFSAKGIKGLSINGFVDDKEQAIKEINQKNKQILTEKCPGCSFDSKEKTQIIPQKEKEACNKHVQTQEYKSWRKNNRKGSAFCGFFSSKTKEQEKICEREDEYAYCCPRQYLKTYTHNYRIKRSNPQFQSYLEGQSIPAQKNAPSCGKEYINAMNSYIGDYTKAIMSQDTQNLSSKAAEFSKTIWKECPDGCSFGVTSVRRFDNEQCSGDIDLKVMCTHQKKTEWKNPFYDILISYEGNVKCQ